MTYRIYHTDDGNIALEIDHHAPPPMTPAQARDAAHRATFAADVIAAHGEDTVPAGVFGVNGVRLPLVAMYEIALGLFAAAVNETVDALEMASLSRVAANGALVVAG